MARRADRVIAISEARARDVSEHLRVRPERHRRDPARLRRAAARRSEPRAELRARLGLGAGPIVLNVAMKKVHKNQRRLVQALPRDAGGACPARGSCWPARRHAVRGASCGRGATALGVAEAVTLPGYVETPTWRACTPPRRRSCSRRSTRASACRCSRRWAAGLPVVTSVGSALPEVAGDAALLVDPASVDEIADATCRVLTDAGCAIGSPLPAGSASRPSPGGGLRSARSRRGGARSRERPPPAARPPPLGAPEHPGPPAGGAADRASPACPDRQPVDRVRCARAAPPARAVPLPRACRRPDGARPPRQRRPVTVGEVFHERDYEPPPELPLLDPQRVLDLGANIG